MDLQWPRSSVAPHIETSHQSVITGELLARPRLQRSHPKIKERMDVRHWHCIEASNKLRLSRVEQMIRDPSEWILHLKMDWAYHECKWMQQCSVAVIPYISLTFMIFYDRNLCSKLKWLAFSWQVHGNATIWIPQASITGILSSSIIHTYFLYKLLGTCRKITVAPSKQVKLSCIAPVESGHCIAVKWCVPWKTLQNLMTWWTWRIEICASLMPPNHFHALNHKLHLKNLDDSFDRESATHLPYQLVQKIHRQQSNAKKILLHLSASYEQMPPKWTHTQTLWKQDNYIT